MAAVLALAGLVCMVTLVRGPTEWQLTRAAGEMARGIQRDDPALVRRATKRGFAPGDERGGLLPLLDAAGQGSEKALGALLATAPEVDVCRGDDVDGETPLYAAVRGGHPGRVRLLLDAGADPNRVSHGMTPLQLAAGKGHEQAVGLLLAAGADPEHRDAQGRSALDWARKGNWVRSPTHSCGVEQWTVRSTPRHPWPAVSPARPIGLGS